MRSLPPALCSIVGVVLATAAMSACSEQGSGAEVGTSGSTSSASPSADASASEDAGETADPSSDSSSDPSDSGSESASDSGTTSEEPALVDGIPVPAGVELTPEGTQLRLGGKAEVAYRAEPGKVAALRVRVDKVQVTDWRTSFEQWRPPADEVTPYFVRARLTNLGDTGLGGVVAPLYLRAGGLLYESTSFTDEFKPCRPRELPSGFPRGAGADVCLVYLVPKGAKAEAVVFRPSADDQAIGWTGKVEDIAEKPDADEGGESDAD